MEVLLGILVAVVLVAVVFAWRGRSRRMRERQKTDRQRELRFQAAIASAYRPWRETSPTSPPAPSRHSNDDSTLLAGAVLYSAISDPGPSPTSHCDSGGSDYGGSDSGDSGGGD